MVQTIIIDYPNNRFRRAIISPINGYDLRKYSGVIKLKAQEYNPYPGKL
jgi:hypothetical protein